MLLFVKTSDVLFRTDAPTLGTLVLGGVHPADDRRYGEVDVPVVATSHPVVVRHAPQIETATILHHRVVRRHHAQHRYAKATYPTHM